MFKKYTYGNNPNELPLSEPFYIEGYDEFITNAGFEPNNEEVILCELTKEWNGYTKGTKVITGIQLAGCPFVVEVKDELKVIFGNGDFYTVYNGDRPITNGNYKNMCSICGEEGECSYKILEECILNNL